MFGNGVMMVGMKTMKMRQPMAVVGMISILKVVQEYCAVVLGTFFRGAVVRRLRFYADVRYNSIGFRLAVSAF
jgi:hypothetical protein